MIHNKKNVAWIVGAIVILSFISCSVGSKKGDELTETYGLELQTVYKKHVKAQIAALETGDTSILKDTATGRELKQLSEAVNSKSAQQVLEARKVEVTDLRVRAYSPFTATIIVDERVVGNVPEIAAHHNTYICQLQKDGNKWKIEDCSRPDFK